ncbi:MAG: MBOAT family O-acyltransferase [Crocinitomicaceae bacterium]
MISIQIGKNEAQKKRYRLLALSVLINLGTLFVFKYYNFFVDNFIRLFDSIGYHLDAGSLNVILPVGISFYTFQSMSYTIDVYRKDIQPTKDLPVFLAYISFFPQLVAGPIERASHLIPQFIKKREFSYDYAVDGLRRVLWGFFKKVVIADNCAVFVNKIFESYPDYSGSTLVLGMFIFAFQLYCDFSGYSDIAIGTAKIFGFDIRENFRFPYFSENVTDFWRRWHISLSSWLRDYLYTPIAIRTRDWGTKSILFATMVSFVLIGFWHGANWTFVVFGFLQGFIISYELLTRNQRKKIKKKMNKNLYKWIGIISTFIFFVASLVFFRSESLSDAMAYFSGIFSKSLFTIPSIISPMFRMMYVLIFILVFIIIEWRRKDKEHVLQIENLSAIKRWFIYSTIICLIIVFARFNANDFIYFQF